MPDNLSYRKKLALSAVCALATLAIGCTYHFIYAQERARTREAVRGLYLEYFGHEPDPQGLAHWTRWAQDRWGIEKVERLGFEAEREKERKAAEARP